MHKDELEEVLSRGVGEFIDPDNKFREKLEMKLRGEYDKDIVIKFGVDPTRPDIHLGHAVVLRRLRQFQELGCKVIFLVGDFTAQIGDPSGKSKVRPAIEQAEVEKNMKTFLDQVGKILRTDDQAFSWIRNSEWFVNVTDIMVTEPVDIKIDEKPVDQNSFVGKALLYENTRMQKTHLHKNSIHSVSLIQMLSNLKHITHSRLIARDMFQDRIRNGEELYMHEMMYPILQGMDSVVLAQIYGSCDLEIGGTDQTFNMLVGRDLMKANKLPQQAVLSMEIIVGTDGVEKMSKSLDNYIAITDAPGEMFGKAMSVPDKCIESYFKLATYTPEVEVKEILEKLSSGKLHPRDVKLRLAREITAIYHGDKAAKEAEEGFVETFSKGGIPKDVPTAKCSVGTKISEVVMKEGIVDSKSEWRRLVEEGAVTNMATDEKVSDIDATVKEETLLKIGKHRFLKIEIN